VTRLQDELERLEKVAHDQAAQKIRELREYARLLSEGAETREFQGGASISLSNAQRLDDGLPALPYRRDSQEYIVADMLLDGEWHAVSDIHAALAGKTRWAMKPQIPNLLTNYKLGLFGLRLEKRPTAPAAYRIVKAEK
jgi:hypothetical protein